MLPGVRAGIRPGDCMFPWSMPEAVEPVPAPEATAGPTANHSPTPEEEAEVTPVAYRAWWVEHADELRQV